MPAQRGAAFLHVSLSALALGLEHTLFVLSGVLVRRVIDGRTVSFDNLMLYPLSVCNLAGAFCVSV
jgi:hypothetical protein